MLVSRHHVHIWHACLNQPETYVQQLISTLSSDEQARASLFRSEQDRRRYIVSHGLLRCILGSYLQLAPDQVQFHYENDGKPAIEGTTTARANMVHFNMSHSHEMALYAVTRGRAVGIDIEYMRHVLAIEQLVDRFFSRAERDAFHALAPNEREAAFFRGWTRKEACLKAIGTGLKTPLASVEVSFLLNEPAVLLNIGANGEHREHAQEAIRWALQDIKSAHGYVAALAVEETDYQLTYYQVQHPQYHDIGDRSYSTSKSVVCPGKEVFFGQVAKTHMDSPVLIIR